jgi:hypothetical protein
LKKQTYYYHLFLLLLGACAKIAKRYLQVLSHPNKDQQLATIQNAKIAPESQVKEEQEQKQEQKQEQEQEDTEALHKESLLLVGPYSPSIARLCTAKSVAFTRLTVGKDSKKI